MLAADTSLSVVLVRLLNMFPVVACLFNAFAEYTWVCAKSQATPGPLHISSPSADR